MSLRSGGVTERLVKFGAGRYDGFYVGWFGEGEPKDVDDTKDSKNRGPLSRSRSSESLSASYGEDEDSSGNSARPPRRPRRPYYPEPKVQRYDPRIATIFAEHQQLTRQLRTTQNNSIRVDPDDWRGEIRKVEIELPTQEDRQNMIQRSNREGLPMYQELSLKNHVLEQSSSMNPMTSNNLTDSVPASPPQPETTESLKTKSASSLTLQSVSLTGDSILSAFDVPGNWSGRGQHVEFSKNEDIPLEQGASLGRGSSADVHEVTCKGIKLARKQIYCTKRVKINDVKRELDVLKKLNHKHVVILVGSYAQIRIFGLLLYPAAVCDLAVYLDELDEEQQSDNVAFGEGTSDLWERLGIPSDLHHIRERLKRVYGCLANAVQYLHAKNVRHKDLKPRNILLDRNEGLYVTDFGLSRDTSDASTSVTNGIDCGTYKYCAPEVARLEPRGRAADIYSLGCVFLEMFTVYRGLSLADFDKFRTKNEDRSFQNCPEKISLWMKKLQAVEPSPNEVDEMINQMIQDMMFENAALRPRIGSVCWCFREAGAQVYFSSCCRSEPH